MLTLKFDLAVKLKKLVNASPVQLLLSCIGSFLLFFPILGRTFASDDFKVIKRVGMDKNIQIRGFFRPLSDITLYVNYLLGGFEPAGYYVLNILVHGVNTFLLLLFCLRWKWTEDQDCQRLYALIAALLFLTYPFHNEGIVWILGRGASICTLFGLAAMVTALSDLRLGARLFWAGLFYFTGMLAYEPVILLPAVIGIVLYIRKTDWREMVRWCIVLGSVLLLHLAVRTLAAGRITGGYGDVFFRSGLRRYAENSGKVAARLFLPPFEIPLTLLLSSLVLLLLLSGAFILFYRRTRYQPGWRLYLGALLLLLSISSVIPVVSAVSIRTSESDRLLYFPSLFLCCMVSFLLVTLVRGKYWLAGMTAFLLLYNIGLLEKNNLNWVKASGITREILTGIGRQDPGKRIFLINLPDESDGAFIFRQGLPEALLMKGVDTSRMVIASHLGREASLLSPDSIRPKQVGAEVQIGPDVTIGRWGKDSFRIGGSGNVIIVPPQVNSERHYWLAGKDDVILYWNKKRLLVWRNL